MSTLLERSTILSRPRPKPPGSPQLAPPSSSAPGPSTPTPAPSTSSAVVAQLRSLVFHGQVTLAITVAGGSTAASSSSGTFYLQAPRIAYLPLLVAQIKSLYLPLVSDEVVAEDQLWFDYKGVPLKWHWPIGLLFDYHTAHAHFSSPPPPASLASYFSPPPSASATEPPLPDRPQMFELTLHLKDPPTDALLLNSSVETCRGGFMNMLKEADFVRWGSVKRVTNLRKEQQDNLWEGVVQNDYEKFWAVASKLVPLPSASLTASPSNTRSPTPNSGGSSMPSDGRLPEANAMRSVPMRVYLPEGAPVQQGVVAPVIEGRTSTLLSYLTTVVPLFFPPNRTPLARPLIHGIAIPLETELGWLGSCMVGADGWIAVVVKGFDFATELPVGLVQPFWQDVVAFDERTITVKDACRKAMYHYLVIPRDRYDRDGRLLSSRRDLSDLRSLLGSDSAEDVLFDLEKAGNAAKELIKKRMREEHGFEWEVSLGFHPRGSMLRVHLHVISMDYLSPNMNSERRYKSFHPTLGYFLPLDGLIAQVVENGHVELVQAIVQVPGSVLAKKTLIVNPATLVLAGKRNGKGLLSEKMGPYGG
ncbi:autophagy-related protein 5 [Pseudohyphozyma bogoriensis]|nr:autophagy-related protein 5 [Pseudohyphozyma bogoriensis]